MRGDHGRLGYVSPPSDEVQEEPVKAGGKKRFFNAYEACTDTANDFGKRVWCAIEQEVGVMADLGYSLRDIESVLHSEISARIAEMILKAGMAKKRKEREGRG